MTLSSPPDPTTTTTTTTAAATITTTTSTTTRPIFSLPTYPTTKPPQRLPSNPNYSQLIPKPSNPDPQSHLHSILYPVASSGRGYLPKPSNNCPNRPVPFGMNHMDPGSGARPTHLQHALLGSSPAANSAVIAAPGGVLPGAVKGFPVVSSSHPKIASTQPSISDCNGFRDRSKDDTFAIIRDRKVRISDNASLYALCRSWLRSGLPDETQTLAASCTRCESPLKKDGDKEEEEEIPYLGGGGGEVRGKKIGALGARMSPRINIFVVSSFVEALNQQNANRLHLDGESVEHLSPKELLQRHVKRAKRIRSRLREERLRRIAKYKTRLALLLPPMVEQQFRNDAASGN
ncbi:hypothetical protein RND71_007602 [Anisodus tanguticus]|uniref:Uncharacterized protein n=1 Tax=Anisodus tanguticus TaxID=243964 RepID=A0AAE1VJ97_9SOLA|nr:hypothetical protein RND71_007602 [Anisodus tanguticus]